MKDIIAYMCFVICIVVLGALVLSRYESKQNTPIYGGDYQIQLDNDSIYIYDGERRVGACTWSNNKFDSILLIDNQ
jgi:hypothetical protein